MKNNSNHIFNKIVKNSKGLSLVEILIALTLLGIVGGFVTLQFTGQLNEGKVDSAKIQINNFEKVLKDFKRVCGFYPSSDQGMEALISKPTSGKECKRYRPGGFLSDTQIPNDPWDNEYIYESDGKTFNITSLGADGLEGGEDFDADISLKDMKNRN